MKKLHFPLFPLLVTAIILAAAPSCKTNEKNYRRAYEKATAANDRDVTPFDRTIYARYRNQARDLTLTTVAGDTVPAVAQQVAVTPDGGGINEWLKTYSIVAGSFKQLFNARSLAQRLAQAGVPRAFVVQTAEPYYYVLAGSYNDRQQAVDQLNALSANPPLPLRQGHPFILVDSRR